MRMGVNKSGEDVLPSCIDNRCPGRNFDVCADFLNLSIVGDKDGTIGNSTM